MVCCENLLAVDEQENVWESDSGLYLRVWQAVGGMLACDVSSVFDKEFVCLAGATTVLELLCYPSTLCAAVPLSLPVSFVLCCSCVVVMCCDFSSFFRGVMIYI